MITRRHLLATAGAGAALAVSGSGEFSEAAAAAELSPGVPDGIASYVTMGTLPGKKPLIQLADRPPNYESPLEYFRTPITPNDQFFVRYHLADIPEVKADGYKISVGGDGASGQAEITLADLKAMPATELVAVNQCSGNRRGLSKPHVAGVEWGYGAMGCARWKGAKLKDVLARWDSSPRQSRLPSTAPTARRSTRRRTSSRAFRLGRRQIPTPSSPTR
jgi:DMSO/TMAO reductase YedYZ molybdopterin-dependent catalytic subunit